MKRTALIVFMAVLSLSAVGNAQISVGTQAPAFTLTDTDNNQVSLSDYTGKVVLLYFIGYN